MSRLGFPVFDADNHMYESREALTKYLPDAYAGAIKYIEVDGATKIVVRGQISDYIPNPTFDRIGRPGAQAEYFRHGNPEGKTIRQIIGRGIDCPDAFRRADARLELLDEQGVDYALVLPTLASLVEERMRDDPDLCSATIHALNLWMSETWPFVYENRIFSTPVITPGVLENAIAELEWVLSEGARAVLMRPAPAWGYMGPRSFAAREFDPFWELVQESRVLVVLHASDTGYTRYYNEWEGERGESKARFTEVSPFSHALRASHRDIQDAVTSLICHGVLWRFPRVKVALIENGAGWLPGLLHHLDASYAQIPQMFPEKPSATFNKNFWMHPFHEEDPASLIELLGAEHVIFGSDFPHVEGLADPLSWAEELDGLDSETLRKVMGANMMGLLGVTDQLPV